ncbi:MAG TPA: parallel beta-helix domain-containing protein, partial [Daejeonella sp.]|nr:parallel beta-helix domain-containing protein [Daejeonella sp.]
IQQAVNNASPGDVIKIMPGVYNDSILVDKPGITLKGTGKVVINNPGDLENGITVRSNGDNFTLENVTVQGFEENGVFLVRVDGFTLRNVVTIDNGEYGLFPVVCSNGKIEHCTASGHSDTGIYVGQSTDVEISHCTAFENVLGIEVENCSRIQVLQNHSYNNVTGILAVLLPRLLLKESSGILISKNIVTDNNHVNFAPAEGGFESVVPSGIGILIVGTDRTTVEQNQVKGNDFLGIGVFSSLTIGQLANIPPAAFDIEPNADFARIINNNLVNNATRPSPLPFLPAVDLIWDGSGTGNCWQGNNFTTSVPSPLPTCN